MGYISKKQREEIKQKFGGLCAYSGTPLEDDWQVDHIKSLVRNWWDGTSMFPDAHCDENLVPVQKIINHYKGSKDLETFRTFLCGLHERLDKPKNPRTEKSKRKKEYLNKVASYFGITPTKPFDGIFYFERVGKEIYLQDTKFKVSISDTDRQNGSPKIGDMIARNPKNHNDQWLVAKQYFENNFKPIEPTMRRNLSGIYIFDKLEGEEKEQKLLAKTIKDIGEQMDLVRE